jgi:hypothetical protein
MLDVHGKTALLSKLGILGTASNIAAAKKIFCSSITETVGYAKHKTHSS